MPTLILEDSDQYENIGILMTLSMIGKTCDLTEKKAGTAWGNPIYVAIFPSKVIDSDLFWPKVIIPVAHSYYTNTL